MADDVTFTVAADATPPGGTKAATDEITVGPHTGAHAGIAKLAVSDDGDGTHIPATAVDGLLVEVSNASIPVTGGLTDAELRATPVDVDGSGVTQPISAAALPLPAGAATAANQLPNGHDVTVDNGAGAAAVNIQDGGNVITVDGTVAVTGGGTSMPDQDVFTVGTELFTPIGGISGVGGTVDSGDAGAAQITEFRALHVNLRDSGGTELGDSTDDPLIVSTGGVDQPVSNAGLAELAGAISGTEVQVDVVGALPAGNNNIGDVDVASIVPGTGATNLGKADSAVHTSGDVGVEALAVRNDGTSALAADGEYSPLQMNFDLLKTEAVIYFSGSGGGRVPVSDPAGDALSVKNYQATATRTQVADSATDVAILASNLARKKYAVYNDSTAVLYLADGAAATTTNYTVQIPPNGYFENVGYVGAVRGIWATDPGTGAARITEYT